MKNSLIAGLIAAAGVLATVAAAPTAQASVAVPVAVVAPADAHVQTVQYYGRPPIIRRGYYHRGYYGRPHFFHRGPRFFGYRGHYRHGYYR